jgi:hypothetical protein
MSQAETNWKLRQFRAGITERAKCVHHILDGFSINKDVVALVHRGSDRGRQRAAVRLRTSFPAAFEWRQIDKGLLGAYLEAVKNPIIQTPSDPGQTQSSVFVSYLVLGTKDVLTATGLWTFEVPDHALRRAFERDPYGDTGKKIYEAHKAILRISVDKLPSIGSVFLIPTSGPGVFVVEWIAGHLKRSGKPLVYARARTWLHNDQLFERQTRQIVPLASNGESTILDSGLLTPVILRDQEIDFKARIA